MNRNQTRKVLMKDEEVFGTYQPNVIKMILTNLFVFVVSIVFVIIFLLIGEFGEVDAVDPEAYHRTYLFVKAGVLGGLVVIFLLALVLQLLAYRNRFYTVTNKRFIIQRGLIGIDFQSIPVHAVQYISVNVSFIDKILNKGTGTIVFGTMSTPVSASEGAKFVFSNLPEVYENYRKFKELIDQNAPSVTK